LEKRDGFSLVTKTLSEKDAKAEAGRCLLCNELCEICVSVCPNRANISYRIVPKNYALQDIFIKKKIATFGQEYGFGPSQKNQTANLGSYCNECGNCTTFCPSAGSPYVDKPKIYLTKEEFDHESDNAFYLSTDEIYGKINKKIYRLKRLGNFFELETEILKARIAQKTLKLLKIEKIKKDGELCMNDVAGLAILLEFLPNYVRLDFV
jgi:putative selenate reductase